MIFLKVVWLYFIVLKSRFKVERRPSSAFPRVHQGVRDFSRDNCAKIEYHLKQLDYFEIVYYVTTNSLRQTNYIFGFGLFVDFLNFQGFLNFLFTQLSVEEQFSDKCQK